VHDIYIGRLRCAFTGWVQPVRGTKNVPCCGRPPGKKVRRVHDGPSLVPIALGFRGRRSGRPLGSIGHVQRMPIYLAI
jgi:hypothetical protein